MAASDNKSELKADKKSAGDKTTAKKTAASEKKPAAKKAGAVKASAVKNPVEAKKTAAPKMAKPGAEERYRMTEVAAYFIAERNKFAGNPVDYWTAAEAQVEMMLAKK